MSILSLAGGRIERVGVYVRGGACTAARNSILVSNHLTVLKFWVCCNTVAGGHFYDDDDEMMKLMK